MEGLSLIIPAHNSGKVIESSLNQYYSFFSKMYHNFEIIVICNDCWDDTLKKSQELSKKLPVRAIAIPQRGKGYALTKGFNNARFDTLGFLDADNPFSLEKIKEMIKLLDEYDSVIASKYIKGDNKKQDLFLRRFISIGGSIVSRFFFGLKFSDTQAGAKFFKRKVWSELIRKYPKFVCNGFDWDIEFLYRIKKNKFKIAEFYIPVHSEKFSTFRLKYIPGMLKRLLLLRFIR